MKNAIYTVILFSPFFCLAQTHDTLFVSKSKSSYLIMDSEVQKFRIGTKDIQIASEQISPNIIMLQAKGSDVDKNFVNTNLLVIDVKGRTYYYDILYKDNLANYTFRNTPSYNNANSTNTSKIESESDTQKNEHEPKTKNLEDDEIKKRELICEKINKISNGIKTSSTNQSITFSFLDLFNHNEKDDIFFFKFSIENKSSINFDIDFINFFRQKNKVGKQKTEQSNQVFPIFTCEIPSIIPPKTKKNIIFAFSKFTMEKNEELLIDIKEKSGEREIILNLPAYFVLYAKKINK